MTSQEIYVVTKFVKFIRRHPAAVHKLITDLPTIMPINNRQLCLLNEFDVVAEPAAATGYAAVLSGRVAVTSDENCAVIICGANTN